MRDMTWDQMAEMEGGDWWDVLKGVACGGGLLGAAYFTGPLGIKVLIATGAVANCMVLFAL